MLKRGKNCIDLEPTLEEFLHECCQEPTRVKDDTGKLAPKVNVMTYHVFIHHMYPFIQGNNNQK